MTMPAERKPVPPLSATGENWEEVQSLLHSALECELSERAAFLDKACSSPTMRAEVESLLAAHDGDGKLDQLASSVMGPIHSAARISTSPLPSHLPRYEIIAQLGAGGMGIVFKARDVRLDRIVVLKFLPPHLSSDDIAKKRFLLEAQAAAALEHPNICTIHEIGEADDGKLYIVMGFYEGETLAQRIARAPLQLDDAIPVVLDIARGLSKAHEHGIVHRDIKPANVILTTDGVVKILDFGIAKLRDNSLTQTHGVLGTFAYMSPEQAFGETVDSRTDIWALGVMFYEMLTATNPFRRENEQAMMYAVLTAEPEPIAARIPAAPPALEALLRRALAKQKSDRFATVGEMAQALEALARENSATRASRSRPSVLPAGTDDSALTRGGERRQATVVVSQICGYAELVERAGPEDLDALTAEIREAASVAAGEQEGILNSFAGDEFVTLFGIPSAREDSFVRGARAAIAIHDRVRDLGRATEKKWGISLELRSGMHTGVLVAQRLRSGDQRYRLAGAPLTTATRLAAVAGSDAVLLSPEAQRLVAPFFQTEPVAPVTLSADAAPSTPFRLVGESGLQTRLDAARAAGLTPYVGRERELRALEELADRAAGGEGQFAVVLGEAGVGKSRLLFELQQVAGAAGARVLTGRGDSGRTSTPYLPFIQAIETALSVSPDRSDTTAVHDQVVAAIRNTGGQLEDYVPFLLNLLAIPSTAFPVPQQLQKEDFHASMMEAVTALLTLQARHAPLLLVMEDWHWADDASRQVLHQIADIAPGYRLLVAVSSRPDPTLEWGSGEHQRLIHLGPVGADASFELLKAVLKVDRITDELAREVLTRAGGNPFFIEEICHSLVEGGIVRCDSGEAIVADRAGIAHLPDTIQAVVGTRISVLDPVARDVLKVAAVIGTDFPRHILEQLVEHGIDFTGSLERLKSAGLIQQTAVVPKPVFRFRHVLIREVAYDSLLERQRSLLHGAAARAIEADAPERADEQADVLAHHFSLAGEWSSAISYATAAADRAAKLNEFPHCLAMLDAAREWVVRLPQDDTQRALTTGILFRQERVCETLGFRTRQQQLVSELVAMLEPAGESEQLAEAYLRQGELHTLLRQFYLAGQDLQTSLRIARGVGDAAGERKALRSLAFLRWHESDFPAAIALVQESVELDRSRGDLEALQGDLNNLGQLFKGAGDYPRALESLQEALELASQRGDVAREAYMLSATGQVYRAMGDLDVALDCLRRSDDNFRTLKLPIQRSFALISVAHVLLDMGKTDDSLESYREAVDVCRRTRYALGLAQALRILGEVLATLGRDSEAVPCLSEAADLFAHLGDPETEAAVWTKSAGCLERLERWTEAHSAWEAVRALPRTGGRRAELRVVEGIARTARSASISPETVIRAHEEALELSMAADDRARCGAARNTLGILEWERGGYEAAAVHYAAAREIFRELGDRVHEGLMLNSLGMCLLKLSRLEEARTALRAALDLNVSTSERLLQAHSLSALGELALSAGELDQALETYERSLALRREIGDRKGEGWTLFQLAKVRFAQGDSGGALLLRQSASALALDLSDAALQLACDNLKPAS